MSRCSVLPSVAWQRNVGKTAGVSRAGEGPLGTMLVTPARHRNEPLGTCWPVIDPTCPNRPAN